MNDVRLELELCPECNGVGLETRLDGSVIGECGACDGAGDRGRADEAPAPTEAELVMLQLKVDAQQLLNEHGALTDRCATGWPCAAYRVAILAKRVLLDRL